MTDDGQPGMAISCEELVELVTDYLEGALDRDTHAELEAHLRLCAGCEEYLRQMRATIRALGYVPAETLSDRAKDELMVAFRGFRAPGGA